MLNKHFKEDCRGDTKACRGKRVSRESQDKGNEAQENLQMTRGIPLELEKDAIEFRVLFLDFSGALGTASSTA